MKKVDVELDCITTYLCPDGTYFISVRTDKRNSHGQYFYFKIETNNEINDTIKKLCELLKDQICEGHYAE